MANKENQVLRVPPNSKDAEAAVIGCMLIDPQAISKAFQILNIDSFYNSSNATIFRIMLDLR